MAKKEKKQKEKPLKDMTVKDLRAIALQIPDITGVHGMTKEEIISAIKESRGIVEEKKKAGSSNRELKDRIKALREKISSLKESANKKMAGILRKRAIRLKKRTRRTV